MRTAGSVLLGLFLMAVAIVSCRTIECTDAQASGKPGGEGIPDGPPGHNSTAWTAGYIFLVTSGNGTWQYGIQVWDPIPLSLKAGDTWTLYGGDIQSASVIGEAASEAFGAWVVDKVAPRLVTFRATHEAVVRSPFDGFCVHAPQAAEGEVSWFSRGFMMGDQGTALGPISTALERAPQWRNFEEAWSRYEAFCAANQAVQKNLEIRQRQTKLLAQCLKVLCGFQDLLGEGLIHEDEICAIADVVMGRLRDTVYPWRQVTWIGNPEEQRRCAEAAAQKEHYRKLQERVAGLERLAKIPRLNPWVRRYFVEDCRKSFEIVRKITAEDLEEWEDKTVSVKEIQALQERAERVFASF